MDECQEETAGRMARKREPDSSGQLASYAAEQSAAVDNKLGDDEVGK